MTACPQCAADWTGGLTCEQAFHQMLFWENEQPALGIVHHLMVLCYYLQHPSLYSMEGLNEGQRLLVEFVEKGAAPQEIRRKNRERLDSSRRTFNIRGDRAQPGAYSRPVHWRMTAGDVAAGGADGYVENTRAWARTVLEDLRAAGV